METIKKELQPIILFIASVIVFGTLAIFGMVYNLFKSIYESFQLEFWKGLFKFIWYWLCVLYQLWNVLKCLLVEDGLAISIDKFGNVAGGEMLEDCVTTREDTLYGRGDVTISAATGKEEMECYLNKTGAWLTNLLSTVLGKGHSITAYKNELAKIK